MIVVVYENYNKPASLLEVDQFELADLVRGCESHYLCEPNADDCVNYRVYMSRDTDRQIVRYLNIHIQGNVVRVPLRGTLVVTLEGVDDFENADDLEFIEEYLVR